MRTTIQALVFEVCNAFGWTERPYSVEGDIAFKLLWHEAEPDLPAMRQAIIDIDAEHPWKDFDLFHGEAVPSINFLSDGQTKVDNWTTPVKTCWFAIYPGIDHLGKGQLHAYERYLCHLATKLKERKLPFVAEVRCVMVTRRVIAAG